MHLFAGANTGHLDRELAVPDEDGGDIGDLRRRYPRNVRLAPVRPPHGTKNDVHCVVQAQQEPRHVLSGDRDRPPSTDLLVKQGDHRPARSEHVPVADADKPGIRTGQVGAEEDALLEGLSHPHHVDGFTRLVRRDAYNGLYRQSVLTDGAHDIFGPCDIGLHGLERKILAARDLFECRRVEHDVGILDGGGDAVDVAHVPDTELHQLFEVVVDDFVGRDGAILISQPHVMLFRLITGEDNDLPRPTDLVR